MIELAKQFLSKECIVFYFDSHVKGTILEVGDGAILLATKYGKEIINLNFVTRICECSKKKK